MAETLVAVLTPDGRHAQVVDAIDSRLRDRVVALDFERPTPDDWATAALNSASAP